MVDGQMSCPSFNFKREISACNALGNHAKQESADSRAAKTFLEEESAVVSFFDLPAGWP